MNYRFWRAAVPALPCCVSSLICLLAGTAASLALAAGPADHGLSLREAVTLTLAANPGLAVYGVREQALSGLRDTAGLRPPLQMNAGAEDALGSGALSGVDAAEFTLSLSQVVELGGQRDARVSVAGQRAAVLQAERRIAELDLLAEVTRRFIATAAAQQRLVLQQRAAALAQQTRDALQPLVAAGQAPASEEARATAALERARLAESHARATLDAARITLSSMWAVHAPEFERVSAALFSPGEPGDLGTLLLGIDENPDLLLYASEERLAAAQVREAASESRGTVQWTAGIRHLRQAGDTGFVLGVSMPLGSRERASGALATAAANRREVTARRSVALNQMRAQVSALHLQLTQAIREVNTLSAVVLPQLDAAQDQTRAAYLSGRYSYLELISAQTEYLDAERALINAAADAHLLRTEIERLSGAALNPESTETNP